MNGMFRMPKHHFQKPSAISIYISKCIGGQEKETFQAVAVWAESFEC